MPFCNRCYPGPCPTENECEPSLAVDTVYQAFKAWWQDIGEREALATTRRGLALAAWREAQKPWEPTPEQAERLKAYFAPPSQVNGQEKT